MANGTLIKEAAGKLLSLLGVQASVDVSEDKENEAWRVQIETEDAGVLIGHHGETVGALQLLLAQIVYKKEDSWQRILVNVGDWRERREETIRGLARAAAQRAKDTGEPQPIFDLTPAERRIAHLELAEDEDVATESEGEGRERQLVVKPKSQK